MKYVEINDLNMGEVFINPEQISSFGYIMYNSEYDNQATIAIKMSNDDLFEVLASNYIGQNNNAAMVVILRLIKGY